MAREGEQFYVRPHNRRRRMGLAGQRRQHQAGHARPLPDRHIRQAAHEVRQTVARGEQRQELRRVRRRAPGDLRGGQALRILQQKDFTRGGRDGERAGQHDFFGLHRKAVLRQRHRRAGAQDGEERPDGARGGGVHQIAARPERGPKRGCALLRIKRAGPASTVEQGIPGSVRAGARLQRAAGGEMGRHLLSAAAGALVLAVRPHHEPGAGAALRRQEGGAHIMVPHPIGDERHHLRALIGQVAARHRPLGPATRAPL
ncbi:MAG: hypothetical protein B7Z30_01705, partial [Rhizobiales bacterium 12-68-15]